MALTVNAIDIPGERNIKADTLFRTAAAGDHEITARAQSKAQRCVIWYGPGSTWCTDGLAADWGRCVVLLHPPIPHIIPFLKKAKAERTRAIILLPSLKNQLWSPLLEELITRQILRKDSKEVLIPGEGLRKTGESLPLGGYKEVWPNLL
ncbi:uncharacterized protein MONOS_13045 [Monocercomonoides exilis]|uniref:uncharacterized protein n=1 Tax=Monocercomonoides exilis TaxID=2049356 RepID=UPI00355A78EF|nr:hypothetical protein MONOS_13045 [Monocercomonoides exilis]|eukprot:MONOS_13045.1-p1 / transcript=MONOS_13045.1 / gene=MONOS_13045 / organism=Monocercomonoides_exilis_PA203 / gene_product=unspecified product / transcript_product=unspecified product / location=Mono_scaffold00770:27825-28328(+) / protein_length=150 / sequence_SO=supercontig / SO=protein_coding / is_pseudo=false